MASSDPNNHESAANGDKPTAGAAQIPHESVTGIKGHDGSYLTEFLLSKGYEVHGPPTSTPLAWTTHYADLSDASSLRCWDDLLLPDEVYNLAAQSHVAVSFEIPDYTADVVATGALCLLEAVRSCTNKSIATSSEA